MVLGNGSGGPTQVITGSEIYPGGSIGHGSIGSKGGLGTGGIISGLNCVNIMELLYRKLDFNY
jgi:hypothetical protein